MRRCFADKCTLKPRWAFEYDGLEYRACEKHMEVAERTSRQVMASRRLLYRSKKEAAQELPSVVVAVS